MELILILSNQRDITHCLGDQEFPVGVKVSLGERSQREPCVPPTKHVGKSLCGGEMSWRDLNVLSIDEKNAHRREIYVFDERSR